MEPTKGQLIAAAHYRRHAKDFDGCTFTDRDAEAQFMCETYGGEYYFPYNRRNTEGKFNGFAVGKHILDIDKKSYAQDLMAGDMCKADFLFDILTKDEIGEYILHDKHADIVHAHLEALGIAHIFPSRLFAFSNSNNA